MNGGYLGIDSSVRDSGGQPHANAHGYIIGEFNIKSVTDDVLDELPEYDFSGPDNYSDGLNSNDIIVSDTKVDDAGDISIYIVPDYVGTVVSPMMPESAAVEKAVNAEAELNPAVDAGKVWSELYKVHTNQKTDSVYRELYKKYKADLAPANDVGISCRDGAGVCHEYVCAWQVCRLAADLLSSMGYDVQLSHRGDYASGYDYNHFDASSQGWDKIAKDVLDKEPTIVLVIGFNAEGSTAAPSNRAGTYIAYKGSAKKLAQCIAAEYAAEDSGMVMPLKNAKALDSVEKAGGSHMYSLKGAAYAVQVKLGGFAKNISSKPAKKRYDGKRYQKAVAGVIADGIKEYLDTNYIPK